LNTFYEYPVKDEHITKNANDILVHNEMQLGDINTNHSLQGFTCCLTETLYKIRYITHFVKNIIILFQISIENRNYCQVYLAVSALVYWID
jgi:hypothetical protein